MKKKACIKIEGAVQGVFFRASTRDKAKEIGIKGFVENHDDGTVYIEAEGEEEAISEFIDWCHTGPANAEVDRVNVTYRDISSFNNFQIRY